MGFSVKMMLHKKLEDKTRTTSFLVMARLATECRRHEINAASEQSDDDPHAVRQRSTYSQTAMRFAWQLDTKRKAGNIATAGHIPGQGSARFLMILLDARRRTLMTSSRLQ